MIRSIILRITSFKESKKFFIGNDFFGGIRIIDIPKIIAKNMTCSIFLLLDAALKKFEGTMSTKGCNGPKFF